MSYITIPLRQGYFAAIDSEEYDKVMAVSEKWNLYKMGKFLYAGTGIKNECGKWTTVYLAQVIMGKESGKVIDHINHNTLDNRKQNLRSVTKPFNSRNRQAKNRTSNYPGVWKYPNRQKPWRAVIKYKYNTVFSKYFHTEQEAWEAKVNFIKQNGLDLEGYKTEVQEAQKNEKENK